MRNKKEMLRISRIKEKPRNIRGAGEKEVHSSGHMGSINRNLHVIAMFKGVPMWEFYLHAYESKGVLNKILGGGVRKRGGGRPLKRKLTKKIPFSEGLGGKRKNVQCIDLRQERDGGVGGGTGDCRSVKNQDIPP